MKASYPASHEITTLSHECLALKIARHSPCSACNTCSGLHPPPDTLVVEDTKFSPAELFSDLGQELFADVLGPDAPYLDSCACGHGAADHGASESELGVDEFMRKGRVAIRLDELLQDTGHLLDFEYSDDDIVSLRRQMKTTVSHVAPTTLTAASPSASSSGLSDELRPHKRRRISISSLSDAEEDEDDDEDRPLASRRVPQKSTTSRAPMTSKRGPYSGKHGSKGSKGSKKGPKQFVADSAGKTNGVNGHTKKVKVEEKMDEEQLTRLATGVTVDAGRASDSPNAKPEKAATIELRKGIIRITPVENDGQPRSMILLTGLKTLFQKQLPKMPREYIARLVYDSNSRCLAIIKRGFKVVGGICYRPFPRRGFAEIVFFATHSVDQVKGYGGMLMDHFKAHIKKTYPDMMHFLTYADNYAVGYFEKQGFSKEITLDRSVWAGYIKDYEGGTIMQCTMLRKMDYLDKANIFAQQQEAVLAKIRKMSRSHIVYPGLPQFQQDTEGEVKVDPKDVPGLRESGWTPEMANALMRLAPKNSDYSWMSRTIRGLLNHQRGWAFKQPVKVSDVPDYYDVIKEPMDFETMERKLGSRQYDSIDAFTEDLELIVRNCLTYNPEGSLYAKNALTIQKWYRHELDERMKES